MFRRQDLGRWVEDPWDTPDPEEIDQILGKLGVRTGTAYDACWHLMADFSEAAVLEVRAKQKAYLARYGRQSWLQWADVPVTELAEAARRVSDLLSQENELSRKGEEH